MTLQKRLKRIMRRRDMRVADLARALETPYTTVREWVLHGRKPAQYHNSVAENARNWMERRLAALERGGPDNPPQLTWHGR